MELNPYTTPSAEIHAQPRSGRPGWVWVIFAYAAFSALSSIISYVLIKYVMPDLTELSAEQKQYLAGITAKDYAITFLLTAINLVAAIQLLRLRKNSLYLFVVALLASASVTAWRVIINDGMFFAGGVASVVLSYGLKIAICIYVWKLVNEGVLK